MKNTVLTEGKTKSVRGKQGTSTKPIHGPAPGCPTTKEENSYPTTERIYVMVCNRCGAVYRAYQEGAEYGGMEEGAAEHFMAGEGCPMCYKSPRER